MSRSMRRFTKNRVALISASFLLLITIAAFLAPWIAPYSYDTQNILERLEGPSFRHWMGTDALGRDLFSRILFGAQMSLSVGFLTAAFALVIGTVTGLI